MSTRSAPAPRAAAVVLAAAGLIALAGVSAPARPAAGGRHALVIGVDNYDNPKAISRDANLKFAEADAAALSGGLRGLGFPDGNVVVATSTGGAGEVKATAANIRAELKALAARAKGADAVVVSFSGYEWQEADSDEYYLCPTDARAADKKTLVTLAEVCDAVKQTGATTQLVLIDSCRGLEKGNRPARRPKDPPAGCAVLFGCSAGEFCYETEKLGGGLLTAFAVKGLAGAADADKDGAVTAAELAAYVRAEVAGYARKELKADQVPELLGKTGDRPLGGAR